MITHGGMFYKHTCRSQEFIKCWFSFSEFCNSSRSWIKREQLHDGGEVAYELMELANLRLLLKKSITGYDDSASIWFIWYVSILSEPYILSVSNCSKVVVC